MGSKILGKIFGRKIWQEFWDVNIFSHTADAIFILETT